MGPNLIVMIFCHYKLLDKIVVTYQRMGLLREAYKVLYNDEGKAFSSAGKVRVKGRKVKVERL